MKSKRTRRLVGWTLAALVFACSLSYVFATFRWREISHLVREVNLDWLATGGVSIMLYWLVRTARWQVLLRELDVHIPFRDLYLCSAVALGLAIITPLQSGEVLKIELLKRYGRIKRFSGYSSFLVERVADLAAVLSLAIISLLLSARLGIDRQVVIGILVIILALGAAVVAVFWMVRLPGRAGEFQTCMRDCVRNMRTLVAVFVLTLVGWALVALGWYACLISIGCDVGYVNTVMIMSTMTPLHILSLIPGAVGFAEASATVFLLRLGQSPVYAQAGAIMLRSYGIMILILAAVHWGAWELLVRFGVPSRYEPGFPAAVKDSRD